MAAEVCRCGAARGGGVCPDCATARAQDRVRAIFQRGWDAHVANRAAALAAGAEALAALGPAVVVGVVPRQDRPLAPLPARRRDAFVAHLDRVLAEAFALPDPCAEQPVRGIGGGDPVVGVPGRGGEAATPSVGGGVSGQPGGGGVSGPPGGGGVSGPPGGGGVSGPSGGGGVPVPPDGGGAEDAHVGAEPALIDATCAACQGACCTLGGLRHAFLDGEAVAHQRRRHPGIGRAALRARYLDALPERSVVEACVYQGGRGCVLPRADRAAVCNRYHCNGQTELLVAMRAAGVGRAAIVAHDARDGTVVALYDGEVP